MWMILLFLISFPLYALEPWERLPNIQIHRVLDKNIILINRGLEDGIKVNDHAKLSFSGGFASRAICLKASLERSYWKLYRIPEVSRISKDITYTLEGLADREIDPDMINLRSTIAKIIDEDAKKPVSEEQTKTFDLKEDLPQELNVIDVSEAVKK